MDAYLNNRNAMGGVSEEFSTRSNGILIGAIGAIDGWLVRIKCSIIFWRDGCVPKL